MTVFDKELDARRLALIYECQDRQVPPKPHFDATAVIVKAPRPFTEEELAAQQAAREQRKQDAINRMRRQFLKSYQE
jgi:hypothetical protein